MGLVELGWTFTDKPTTETWNNYEYKVLHDGSGKGTLARESSQVTTSYIVEYNWLPPFVDALLGKTIKSGGSLLRSAPEGSLPEEHPYFENGRPPAQGRIHRVEGNTEHSTLNVQH